MVSQNARSKYLSVIKNADTLLKRCEQLPKKLQEEYGDIALSIIGDYPLYGATSNITYPEAIAIASLLDGNFVLKNISQEESL